MITDVETDRRAIRAIEIEKYYAEHGRKNRKCRKSKA